MEKKVKFFLYVAIPLLVIGLDQASKFIARSRLNFEVNTGLSWGIFRNQNEIAILATLSLLIYIAFMIIKGQKSDTKHLILVTIFFAGCSNLIDRILFGGVTDFIYLFKFPVFNIADFIITSGIIILMLIYSFDENFKTISGRDRGSRPKA